MCYFCVKDASVWNNSVENDGRVFRVDNQNNSASSGATKFCKHCGAKIPVDAVICTACGRQVEKIVTSNEQPNIIINNANTNANFVHGGYYVGRARNKWVAFALCLFLGFFGAHKFYEGKGWLDNDWSRHKQLSIWKTNKSNTLSCHI